MAKRGRKPLDLNLLIWYEWHWWQTFSALRDGVEGGAEMASPWSPPDDFEYPSRPAWMTNPGAVHDWDKKAREDWLSHWEYHPNYSKQIPAERHVWEALKRAETPSQLRRIFSMSKRLGDWSMLDEHAEQFLAALKDSRYSGKSSSKDDQRLLYCARAMAAISLHISPATAVDRLRKLKHGNCNCSHCAFIASLKMKASGKEGPKKS
jgi:hypothetical protein